MNPVFAALSAVAFALMLVGGEASAADHATHREPARKAAPAAKPVAKPSTKPVVKPVAKPTRKTAGKPLPKPVQKPAKASTQPVAKPVAQAVSRPATGKPVISESAKPYRKSVAAVKPAAASVAEPVVAPRQALARGKAAEVRAVRETVARSETKPMTRAERRAAAREARLAAIEARRAARIEKAEASRKGRQAVAEPVAAPVPAIAQRERHGRGGGRDAPPIGREAFTPIAPPLPRAAAMRQLQAPAPLPPAAVPAVPSTRQSVVIPAPAAAVTQSALPRPAVEAPKAPPRPLAPVVAASGMSSAEMAAAAAAAVAPRVAEPAPASVPVPAPAAPAPAVAAHPVAPAPAASLAVPSRPARGVARAYAMDGASFYQSGRKFRVQGLDAREPGMSSEHATQRLQRALDAGNLSVEPVEVDASGHTIAVVRVNGRNVADTVRAASN